MKTQNVYLEHANITVNNLDSATLFFQTAFQEFKIRGGGNTNGRRWIHLGNDSTYLALNESTVDIPNEKNYEKNGFNHIGFVVTDVNTIAQRLLDAGFERDYPKEIEEFRIRDYFADADGNQYEFVQYLSGKIEERNSFA
ncbi:MAG: catechol 2,3-dioxygenase-like lactoylglutathione lyase family enzyme [Crocinitomicaceae bacterium]|jgi:catechol 2,3-dioxygenase-like lactoylglutathione lyase family enzyme